MSHSLLEKVAPLFLLASLSQYSSPVLSYSIRQESAYSVQCSWSRSFQRLNHLSVFAAPAIFHKFSRTRYTSPALCYSTRQKSAYSVQCSWSRSFQRRHLSVFAAPAIFPIQLTHTGPLLTRSLRTLCSGLTYSRTATVGLLRTNRSAIVIIHFRPFVFAPIQ